MSNMPELPAGAGWWTGAGCSGAGVVAGAAGVAVAGLVRSSRAWAMMPSGRVWPVLVRRRNMAAAWVEVRVNVISMVRLVFEGCGEEAGGGRGRATGESGGCVREDVQGGAELGGALGGGEFVAEGGDELLLSGDGVAVFYAGGARAQGCKAALCGVEVDAEPGGALGGGEFAAEGSDELLRAGDGGAVF